MRTLILYLITTFTISLYAQDSLSVITLNEIIVKSDNRASNKKSKFLKSKGKSRNSLTITPNTVFATLIKNEKSIKLKSLELFFNSDNNKIYNKTEFELSFYNVNEDGLPGDKINTDKIMFTVLPINKVKIKLNLSILNIKMDNHFYIGLKKIKNGYEEDFYISLNKKKGDFIYVELRDKKWYKIKDSNFDLVIEYTED